MKANNQLSDAEKISLFKLRVREIKVKANYKNMYDDLKCRLCNSQNEEENQYHLLQCDVLISKCENLAKNVTIEYEDIFESIEKQVPAAKLLHEVLETRKQLIDQAQT